MLKPTHLDSADTTATRRAAQGTALVFALSGLLMATWLSRLPATRDRLHADSGSLGLALLMTGVGSLTLMPSTGRLCARFGSRRVVLATALPACLALLLLTFVPNIFLLGVGLFLLGAFFGSWDVAMNIQGSCVDRVAGRDLMPRYHACWSVGAIVGASSGALAAKLSLGLLAHFSLVTIAVIVGLVVGLPRFLPDRVALSADGEQTRSRDRKLFSRALIAIGLLTLCGTCIEGAAGDWIALYFIDGRGTTQSVAATGFAVFAVAMAGSRFLGTWVIARLGRVAAVRLGGAVTGAGIICAVTVPTLAGALLGALLWGLGVAVVFPAGVSAGGELPGRAADGIAAVSTVGYGGFLIGPPLIGLLARHIPLGQALLVLVVLAVGIVALAPSVRPRVSAPIAMDRRFTHDSN